MRVIKGRSHFEAPIDRVFALATEPLAMPEMLPSVHDITDIRGRGDAVGDSFQFRDRFLGRSIAARTVVTAAARPSLQTTETTYADGSRIIWTMRFQEVGGGTDVDNEIAFEPPPGIVSRIWSLVARPLIEQRVRASTGRFRAMLARSGRRAGRDSLAAESERTCPAQPQHAHGPKRDASRGTKIGAPKRYRTLSPVSDIQRAPPRP